MIYKINNNKNCNKCRMICLINNKILNNNNYCNNNYNYKISPYNNNNNKMHKIFKILRNNSLAM